MKQTLLLFVFILFGSSAFSQDFTFEYLKGKDNIEFELSDQSGQDVVIKGVVRNPSSEEITLTWIRTVFHKNDGWETAICDRNQCYLPFVSTQTVDIPANDTSAMDTHLYPQKVTGDSAIVELALISSAAPDDTMRVIYRFYQKETSSINRVADAEVTIYPNPTVDHFNVRADRNIGSVVVHDILGKEILRKQAYGPQVRVQAGVLSKGVYIVRVLDPEGKVITTRRLRKDNL